MRRWLRTLAIGATAGLLVGLVIGGTLGRIFMRLLFLAQEDTLGFETSMGAIVGELSAGGTLFIYVFGAFFGAALGVAYTVGRTILPSRTPLRTLVFTVGASALMVGQIARANREDFTFLPVTTSLLLIAGSVALTALPVPLLIERYAPDRPRRPGRAGLTLAGAGIAGMCAFAATGVSLAYGV